MANPEPKEIWDDGEKSPTYSKRTGELTLRSGLAVAAGIMSSFVTNGFVNSFGVFQSYYTEHYLSSYSDFDISWLGSFPSFLLFMFGLLAGWMSDKYGPRVPTAMGSIAMLIAVFMISLCTQYYEFMLAQGLLLGLGMSFVQIPAAANASKYFVKNRGLATGIVVSGSSLGGVTWPILFDQLLYHDGVSFGWTMRIAGFIMLPLLAFATLFGRAPPNKPSHDHYTEEGSPNGPDVLDPKERRAQALAVLRKPPFIFFCSGLFLFYLGFQAPIFYTSIYGEHLGFSQSMSFYLISILNAASLPGRIIPGILADKFGRFNLISIATLGAGIVGFCWSSATSLAGVIVWDSAYGFASGAILALQFACPATLADKESAGLVVGAATSATSVSLLVGAPIAGLLVEYGYTALACYTGAMLLAGGVFMLLSRLSQNRDLRARL